jgi:hypothetical protein
MAMPFILVSSKSKKTNKRRSLVSTSYKIPRTLQLCKMKKLEIGAL